MGQFYCDICVISCNSEKQYEEHLASEKHKKKERDRYFSEWHQDPLIKCVGMCTICRISFNSLDQIKIHIHGGTHIKAKQSIRLPKELPENLNKSNGSFQSTSANIPDPRIEINEYIDTVEKLCENVKVLISKL